MPKFSASCPDVVALARANFSCPCVEFGCCTHDIERALSGAARALLCRLTVSCGKTSARARIRWSFTCLVCVSVTATRACPPRTQHHCNRLPHCSHPWSDHEDGFTKLMCYSFGCQHSGTCTRQHSCIFVLFGLVPKHVREHAVANPRWVKDAPDTTIHHLFCNGVHLQFQCFGKLIEGRSITGTDVTELSGRQVPTSMLRSHG